MSNTAATITAINLLLDLVINSTEAVRRYQAMIEKARAEGRDVSDEELAAIQAESQTLTDSVLADLTKGS